MTPPSCWVGSLPGCSFPLALGQPKRTQAGCLCHRAHLRNQDMSYY